MTPSFIFYDLKPFDYCIKRTTVTCKFFSTNTLCHLFKSSNKNKWFCLFNWSSSGSLIKGFFTPTSRFQPKILYFSNLKNIFVKWKFSSRAQSEMDTTTGLILKCSLIGFEIASGFYQNEPKWESIFLDGNRKNTINHG